jgi:hypothetical protein
VIFNAQLDWSAHGVRLRENNAVRAAFQFVMLLESFFVILELGRGHEIYEGHV